MGKLVIVDECLVPRRLTWLKYKGPDPVGFLRDLKTNMRFIFEVSTTRCRQKKLMWDYSGDPIRFYDEWLVLKQLSRFSNMNIRLRLIGYVSKGKQDGDFALELFGDITSTFDPSNWFTKYIWILYNYMFYNKMRESYTLMCRDYIFKFKNWCKEHYNLKTVSTPEAQIESFHEDMDNQEEMEEKGEKEQEE